MIRVKFIIIFLTVLSAGLVSFAFAPNRPVSALTDEVERGLIPWSTERQLDWDDFRGPPQRRSVMVAESFTQLSYYWDCNGDEVEFSVHAHFNPRKSWVRGEPTTKLLEHEQLHFDITELYARRLRRNFSELDAPCSYPKEMISDHYRELMSDWRKTQERYDRETSHSLVRSEQKKWEEWVSEELAALQQYASSRSN